MSDEKLSLVNLPISFEEKERVNEIVEHTKMMLATTKEELLPMCHLWEGPEKLSVYCTPFTEPGSKEKISEMLHKICKENKKVDLLVYVLESFVLKFENEAETNQFQKERRQGKWKSFGDHPRAQDIIMFSVETRQESIIGTSYISKDENGKRQITEPEFIGGAKGLFTGFLKQNGPESVAL